MPVSVHEHPVSCMACIEEAQKECNRKGGTITEAVMVSNVAQVMRSPDSETPIKI